MTESEKRSRSSRLTFAIAGFLLGLGAPAGWLVLRAVVSNVDLLSAWTRVELGSFTTIYVYLTVSTIAVFTVFGYHAGRMADGLRMDWKQAKSALESINALAVRDALTGLFNARYLHDRLAVEIESARRHDFALSCLMADIDDFKRVNDLYGHPAGDAVLKRVSAAIVASVRSIDVVGRLGGEEFLVVMPHTEPAAAAAVAGRVRRAVESLAMDVNGEAIPLTISIGVGWFPSGGVRDKTMLLKITDDALYAAKRNGKNCVALAGEASPGVSRSLQSG